jgi:hypothetical protein
VDSSQGFGGEAEQRHEVIRDEHMAFTSRMEMSMCTSSW